MLLGHVLMAGLVFMPQASAAPPRNLQPEPICAQVLREAVSEKAAAEVCAGEGALRLANAAARESA
jgi:hypothetical protein